MGPYGRIRLVAFDLDGTIVRDGSCVGAIARGLGRTAEARAFEGLSERDVPGITRAREQMARWFEHVTTDEACATLGDLRLAPGCDECFARLRAAGVTTAVVSVGWEPAVAWFADALGVEHRVGTALRPDGSIAHVWPADLGAWVERLREELGVPTDAVAAVGDSDGDRELLASAALRIAVGRAPVDGVPGVVHLPRADLRDVADRILASG
jgi:phosphoserine phosphatase